MSFTRGREFYCKTHCMDSRLRGKDKNILKMKIVVASPEGSKLPCLPAGRLVVRTAGLNALYKTIVELLIKNLVITREWFLYCHN